MNRWFIAKFIELKKSFMHMIRNALDQSLLMSRLCQMIQIAKDDFFLVAVAVVAVPLRRPAALLAGIVP